MNNKKICIVGLGYVGLPLLNLITKKKYFTLGYDKNKNRVSKLKKNISYISDIKSNELKKLNKKNIFSKNQLKQISNVDYIIICLPTPLNSFGGPDLSYIKAFLNDAFGFFKKKQTIILESTVPPGATENIFLKKLNSKFKVGTNFHLCFSPERINPGSKKYKVEDITKVISGYSDNCLLSIKNLYKKIFKRIHATKSIKIAEMSKIYENTYRSVNISLANEMKIINDRLGINIHDVIDASATKEFGFTPFYPGAGVGGHCIPVDPFFLKWIAKQFNTNTEFISLANKINNKVSKWILKKVNKNINSKTRILVIGVSYKKNIDDIRMSPSLIFFKYYLNNKYKVSYYDPYVPNLKIGNKIFYSLKFLGKKVLKKYDKVLILSDHDCLDYKMIQRNSKIIYDTKGRYNNKVYKNVVFC
tara:strand:+ start:3567 stop:4817 length:1251 start_codon:yes stop_codon:yes gene_type:complete